MIGMRIDRFLFFTRIAKSRTAAQAMIDVGQVRINGERAVHRHHSVSAGQSLTITANDRFRVIEITALPSRRGPAQEALSCYIEIVQSQVIDVASPRL
jgi:ribosome-associated heat shock protein Hsp15